MKVGIRLVSGLFTLVVVASLAALAMGGPAMAQAQDGSVAGETPSPLRVVDATLVGGDSWSVWFGAGPTRTLLLTLENTGAATVTDIPVTVKLGRSANPTTEVEIPPLGALSPGEKRRYAVPVAFDAFAVGSYSAAGQIVMPGETLTFAASTTSYPWALIVLPIVVVLEIVLLRGRNRLRRAFRDSSSPTSEVTVPQIADGATIDVDALVDAAITGAFSAADAVAEGHPLRPRHGSPIDVRPIVSAIVGQRLAAGPSTAELSPSVLAPRSSATDPGPRS